MLFYLGNRGQELRHSLCRQILRLHGNDNAVRSRQCVKGNHTEGRHTIYEDIIVVVLYLAEIVLHHAFPAHCGHKAHLQRRQLKIRRHKVNLFLVAENPGKWVLAFLAHYRRQLVGQRLRQTV